MSLLHLDAPSSTACSLSRGNIFSEDVNSHSHSLEGAWKLKHTWLEINMNTFKISNYILKELSLPVGRGRAERIAGGSQPASWCVWADQQLTSTDHWPPPLTTDLPHWPVTSPTDHWPPPLTSHWPRPPERAHFLWKKWFSKGFEEPSRTGEPFFHLRHLYKFFKELFRKWFLNEPWFEKFSVEPEMVLLWRHSEEPFYLSPPEFTWVVVQWAAWSV